MLDHDKIERQGLKSITKVLLGFGGTIVLILGFSMGFSTRSGYLMLEQGEGRKKR